MLIFIAIAGIVQEFLIALYTPKSTIDRKTLSQYSSYINFKDMDINKFLISIYTNYLYDGSYNQEKYDYKMSKVIELIAKKDSNWVENEINQKVEYYKNAYTSKLEALKTQDAPKKIEAVESTEPTESTPKVKSHPRKPTTPERVIPSNPVAASPKEPTVEESKPVEIKPAELEHVENNTEKPAEYSPAVDALINDIEAIE
jgi:hypothetical protein